MNEIAKRCREAQAVGAMGELLRDAASEIDRLSKRLEINPEAPAYDGIACRDETIRQLERVLRYDERVR